MTKVWVPIELPNGYRVREVIAECDEGGGSVSLRRLEPCDTITVDHPWERHIPEPQRERWEYLIVEAAELGDGGLKPSAGQRGCNSFGALGWECFHVNPGAVWFKRRLP